MKPLNQDQVDFLAHQARIGKSIPGQSLTNDPKNPYPWEKPTEFVDLNEASDYMFQTIFEPDVASNILLSINNGVGVFELSSIILYTGFLEGKWNPDLMMLLAEPTMFMIIALCEKADLEYKLESVEDAEEMDADTQIKKLDQGTAYLKTLRKKVESGVSENAVTPELKEEISNTPLPSSLLDKPEESGGGSLLSKGDI